MHHIFLDIRTSVRFFVRKPGFSAIIVLTLALGIGANTAIFSILHAVLINPLPYREPDRIVGLRESLPDEGLIPVSYRSFAEWRDRSTAFERIAAGSNWNPNLEDEHNPVRLTGATVSGGYFDVMGLSPLVGRVPMADDERPDAPRVVVLGEQLWRNHFHSSPSIIGQQVRLSGTAFTVIGVVPNPFLQSNIGSAELWTPMRVNDQTARENPGRYLFVVGRLKAGITLDQAKSDAARVMALIKQEFPETHNSRYQSVVQPLRDFVVSRDVQQALWLLVLAVDCLLLIACSNVAGLLLAHVTQRERELAIRTAIGASQWQIIRQLLVEHTVFAVIGGALGVWSAHLSLGILVKLSPDLVARLNTVSINGPVLWYTLGVTTVAAIVFGVLPAIVGTKTDLIEALKQGSTTVSQQSGHKLFQNGLVVVEISLAFVLMVGAGLLVQSFVKLNQVKPGYDLDPVLTMDVFLPGARYTKAEQRIAFYRSAVERLQAIPGVTAAAAVQGPPLKGPIYSDPVLIEGQPTPRTGEIPFIRQNVVTAGYFRALGIEFLKGRPFSELETWENHNVIVVNQAFARRFWPGEDPLGKRLKTGDEKPWLTVVGVIADVAQDRFDKSGIEEMYYPYVNPAETLPVAGMNLVVRSTQNPESLIPAIRRELRHIDPVVPINRVLTLRQLADQVNGRTRFMLFLFNLFAGLALVLALTGVYAVMTFFVTQRQQEIGIRMAMGATQQQILRQVIRRGMTLCLIGLALGIGLSQLFGPIFSSQVFSTSVFDGRTFAGISVLLILSTLIAVYFPARRATEVDPIAVLRGE
ncbi:MAG: ABC transporter permease [Acidobacteria bacterium]|nr:ABC transporter permease [Acidobacteriota bacterium]